MSTTIDIRTTETQPLILLPTFIDGKGPFSFVLDTGAGISIITEELARIVSLQDVVTKDALGAGGQRVKVLVGRASSMTVGGANVENARVGIMKTLPKCIGQGVIGYDFLRQFVVTIDYGNNRLTFTPPEVRKDDAYLPQAAVPLKLARPDRPVILMDVLVNNRRTYQFILDTGASQTVVSPALAEQVGMASAGEDTIVGAGGAVTSSFGMLKSLRLEDTVLEDVAVIVSDIFLPLGQAVGTHMEGILGYNVLRWFKIILDYPKGRLHFHESASGRDTGSNVKQ